MVDKLTRKHKEAALKDFLSDHDLMVVKTRNTVANLGRTPFSTLEMALRVAGLAIVKEKDPGALCARTKCGAEVERKNL